MKKNIRILAVVLGLLILIAACVPAGVAGENTNVIYGMFHMKLRHNPMLAKYGVTVFFDDIEVGHVAQGEQITFGAYMREGESHVLILRSDKSGIPDHVWTIASIQNGTTFTCRIQTHRKYIDIPETNINVNGSIVAKISPDIENTVKICGTIVEIGAKILMKQSGK